MKNNGDNLVLGCDDSKCDESDFNALLERFESLQDSFGKQSTILQLLASDGVDIGALFKIGIDGFNMPHSKEFAEWRKEAVKSLTRVINCGEGMIGEWPQAGDEVSFPSGSGILTISKPDDNGVVIVECNDEDYGRVYKRVSLSILQKPKTPAEELRDDIVQTIHDDVYHGVYEKQQLEVFANALLSKYNITKKPQ